MPITIKFSTDDRVGLLASTVSAFTTDLDGTHVQPGSFAGSMNPTLSAFSIELQGQFGASVSRDGAVALTMDAFGAALEGAFTAPLDPDVTAPPVPTGLASIQQTATTIALQWNASTDVQGGANEVVSGTASYTLYRDGGPLVTQSELSFVDTGLTAETQYSYQVLATDGAGNSSALSAAVNVSTTSSNIPVLLDGSATAHQIAISVDATPYAQGTTATMRYRESGGSWITGHDLFRVQSGVSATPTWGIDDVFAWPIIGLEPDTEYEIEVTIGGSTGSLVTTTKALPPEAGAADVTVTNINNLQSAINGAAPGDVIEIANGTYALNTVSVSNNGDASNPIYIRGESRNGVVLQKSTGGVGTSLFHFNGTTEGLIFENFTVEGPGGSTAAALFGNFNSGSIARDITVRNITATGIDRGIFMYYLADRWLVYDCTWEGNNLWTRAFYDSSASWDDYGIQLPGNSNEVFNCTLKGFGDTLSFANSENGQEPYNSHAHNNLIWNSCDDWHEADDVTRNVSVYDNLVINCVNASSIDPVYGGPYLHCRNVCINVARRFLHKWNDNSAGMFFYNNTSVSTGSGTPSLGIGDSAIWDQPGGPTWDYFGFDNNISISGGSLLNILSHNLSGGMDNVDWRSNWWYPDGDMDFGNPGDYNDVAAANATSTTNFDPVFGTQTRFVQTDGVIEAQPFITPIALGADDQTEVTTEYYPLLAPTSAAKYQGVVIPGVTDGYTGAAPDPGAAIEGRVQPIYGDRGNTRLRAIADALAAGASNLNIDELRNTEPTSSSNRFDISWCSVLSYYDANRKEIQYMGKSQSSQSGLYCHYVYSEADESWRATGTNLGSGTGHVYTAAFDPVNGEFFFHNWAASSVRRYDRADDSWTDTPSNGNLPGGNDWTAGMVYHPNLFGSGDGGLIFCPTFDTDAQAWRRSNNTWYTLSNCSAQNGTSNGAQGIYIPGLDAAMIAGFSGSAYRIDAGSGGSIGSATALGDPGTPNIGWSSGPSSGSGKAVIDPNNSSRVLVLEFGGSSRVWASTDAGDNWSEVGNHPFMSMDGASDNISFVSIPTYGVIVGLTSTISTSAPWSRVGMWKPDV